MVGTVAVVLVVVVLVAAVVVLVVVFGWVEMVVVAVVVVVVWEVVVDGARVVVVAVVVGIGTVVAVSSLSPEQAVRTSAMPTAVVVMRRVVDGIVVDGIPTACPIEPNRATGRTPRGRLGAAGRRLAGWTLPGHGWRSASLI